MQLILKANGFLLSGIYFLIWFPFMLLSMLFPLSWRLRTTIPYFWSGYGNLTLRAIFLSPIKFIDRRSEHLKSRGALCSALYIANHSSFMDIPLILTQVQIPPLMKKEVLKMPFIGIYGIASGAIPVDRKDPNSRRKVREKMCRRMHKDKFCVQYYPEGTRSKLGHPKSYSEIKTSLMRFAFEQDIPLVAVSMYNTDKILGKNAKIVTGIPLGLCFEKEIYPKDFSDADAFCMHAWSLVEKNYTDFQTILGQ